jgi:quercetin dioxygenase-like cupin family protein
MTHDAMHDVSAESHTTGRQRTPEPYTAPLLTFNTDHEIAQIHSEKPWQAGHSSKTLAKYPNLRVVLVAMEAGARLHQHKTHGSIMIQTVRGRIRVALPGKNLEIPAGEFALLDALIPHEVESIEASEFLLTISSPGAEG